jgi:hypothetical protein
MRKIAWRKISVLCSVHFKIKVESRLILDLSSNFGFPLWPLMTRGEASGTNAEQKNKNKQQHITWRKLASCQQTPGSQAPENAW